MGRGAAYRADTAGVIPPGGNSSRKKNVLKDDLFS